MTKEEAQEILDAIDPVTVIDSNWLKYLIADPEFKALKALYVVSGLDYYLFLERNEGEYISKFQTKKEIYVGKLLKVDRNYFLITSQDDEKVYFITRGGHVNFYNLINVKNYLV